MAGRKATTDDARGKSQPPPQDLSVDVYALNSRIIALLQQDGRMPYSTIAKELGVSEGTVRNRVRQLIDENVITIQAEAMPEAFGYNFNAQTFIKVAGGADIDAVIARLTSVPEVFYLTSTLGRFDLGMATYHQSHEHYRAFLAAHCYGQPDIAAIETCMVLKVHKMKLQWDLEGENRQRVGGKERP
ncbi:Lrp/AsnC family transcriptional regulator [Sphingosinicella soli]|uniref:Lrp/AsnC family transcriptional regulator for asnA, asnC and gidA n=1 Tax=Sphingosinicella soli TaxID=333708 RepID=A0A7W7B4L4_9SPHN|nr:AsnC family transcriptional regulator [Sphingosinicella soli]MBB4633033.1 Lrp/AsnC family transcriptional regulator for asnA, asnC and gidA [Sphingosinicella soli]